MRNALYRVELENDLTGPYDLRAKSDHEAVIEARERFGTRIQQLYRLEGDRKKVLFYDNTALEEARETITSSMGYLFGFPRASSHNN